MNINNIVFGLEEEFHIGFLTKKHDINNYSIILRGSEKDKFRLEVSIKNEERLSVKCEPELYGVSFLRLINNSSEIKRKAFVELWKSNTKGKMVVSINKKPVNFEDFVRNDWIWDNFNISFSELPFSGEKEIARVCQLICGMMFSLFDYIIEGYEEGNISEVKVNKYERNAINRKICLLAKGYTCCVCGFNFKEYYGEIGRDFIEVHHSLPVSEMEEGHIVDPIKELFPVCSNCHSMLHRKTPPYTIEELRSKLEKN